jgi:ABC-type sugar transport system permease subunit
VPKGLVFAAFQDGKLFAGSAFRHGGLFLLGLDACPQPGVIKIIMESVGLGAWYKPWTSLPDSFFDVVIFCVMWQCVGYNMLLFYSGMKSIPEHYFEAARLDGASMLQQVSALHFRFCRRH